MQTSQFNQTNFKLGQTQQWDNVAQGGLKWWSTLEPMTHDVSDELINLARISDGDMVLDLATGIGEPALSIAAVVGESGFVFATDQSVHMLEIARERGKDFANVAFETMDAEDIKIDQMVTERHLYFKSNQMDAVTCRFGLMFMPDVNMALSKIYRLLKPGAVFATSVWDKPELTPFFSFSVKVMQSLIDIPKPAAAAPTMFGLANGVLEQKMTEAGFTKVTSHSVMVNFKFDHAQQFVSLMQDIAAPLSNMLANESEATKQQYWQLLEKKVTEQFSLADGGISLPSSSLCISGEK